MVLAHTASFWNITILWTSHADLTENCRFWKVILKIREIRVVRRLLKWFDKFFMFELCWVLKKMSPKPSTQSGGQTHGWILLILVVYSNQIDLILCRQSCFHCVWLPLLSNLCRKVCRLIITFFTQYILIKVSHSRWIQLVLQKIEWKLI